MFKYFFITVLFFGRTLFGQQLLWTTDLQYPQKTISENQVLIELEKFYDLYKAYHDGTGYSKDQFDDMLTKHVIFKGNNVTNIAKLKSKLPAIETPTYYAFKGNTGEGAIVYFLRIDRENVDVIAFSNEISLPGSVMTNKFSKTGYLNWLQTLGIGFVSNPGAPNDLNNPELEDESLDQFDIKAAFPGGEKGFRDYVASNFKYPLRCQDLSISGSVVLWFVVDESGNISNIKVKEETKACPEFTAEAIRILRNSPRWIPGQNKGRFVKSWREMPIRMSVE